jgi:hypothetical protein
MIEIASRRRFSKVVASPRVTTREQGKIDRGWQGKRPAVGPAYVVGCAEDLVTAAMATAGALHIFSKEIKAASAIAPLHKAVLRHDDARQ